MSFSHPFVRNFSHIFQTRLTIALHFVICETSHHFSESFQEKRNSIWVLFQTNLSFLRSWKDFQFIGRFHISLKRKWRMNSYSKRFHFRLSMKRIKKSTKGRKVLPYLWEQDLLLGLNFLSFYRQTYNREKNQK